jgi:TolB-like protein/DNA-binding winged helix-turn-helix (wHTH) protein
MQAPAARVLRFGTFELDLQTRELRKSGREVRVQEQPRQVLLALLERPGEVVPREELCRRLWPDGTFVDFEHSLNTAVKKLRDALGDAAENPRFVETVPMRGYRFAAPVEAVAMPGGVVDDHPGAGVAGRRHAVVLAAAAGVIVLAMGAWVSRRAAAKAVRQPPITSLVVLPLTNLTGDRAQEYFADGMTDALSGTFSQLGVFTVVSSTSARRYKDTSKPATQIARELGVDALLEGSVLRNGDRVRINAALVDGRTGRRLWAQTYDRRLTDVFALYGDIAQTAAREMSVILTDSQRVRATPSGTVDTVAYDEYLRATYFMNRSTGEGCPKAEPHFLRAIELDPGFAQPQAELVWCYVFPDRMQRPIAELAPKARALSDRALALDPQLASAHIGRGLVRQFIDYDWSGAESAFRRALELDPGSALAHSAYGDLLYMRGRGDESVSMMKRGLQLDPLSPDRRVGLAYGLMNVRRYDEAIEHLRSMLELDPGLAAAKYYLSLTLSLKGERGAAVSAYLDWIDLTVRPERAPQVRAELESIYARSGWQAFWERELALSEEAVAHPGTVWKPQYARYAGPVFMAVRYARLGRTETALALLESACAARQHLVVSLNSNPSWDQIRDEPRFQALVRRVGLAP